jgi:hypothetical protein
MRSPTNLRVVLVGVPGFTSSRKRQSKRCSYIMNSEKSNVSRQARSHRAASTSGCSCQGRAKSIVSQLPRSRSDQLLLEKGISILTHQVT